MIDRNFPTVMATYNSEMNRRLFAASRQLTDPERRLDRGAFWCSIHGTLCHQLWGAIIWPKELLGLIPSSQWAQTTARRTS
jgi:uncharacterized damage-inducible protein DinB